MSLLRFKTRKTAKTRDRFRGITFALLPGMNAKRNPDAWIVDRISDAMLRAKRAWGAGWSMVSTDVRRAFVAKYTLGYISHQVILDAGEVYSDAKRAECGIECAQLAAAVFQLTDEELL